MKELYEKLRGLNVVGHVEQKNGLNYLSWAWAWDEIMKIYPEAVYEIERFDNKPYLYDDKTGYMVFTKVKIQDMEREMWLPVMDSNNNAMLDHEYTYTVNKYEWKNKVRTKVGEETKKVEAATMFDINKTIMRCLTKNLAMFGLGLYIYAGEDLPEEEATRKITPEQIEQIEKLVTDKESMLTYYKIKKIEDMSYTDAEELIARKSKKA